MVCEKIEIIKDGKTNLKSFAFTNLKFKYAKVIWMFYRKPYSKKWTIIS